MSEVSKEEWQDWKKNKVTKQLVSSILLKREILTEGIVEGHIATEEERLIAIGKCQALKDITMFVVEEFDYMREQDGPESDSV